MIDPTPIDLITKSIIDAPFESRSVELKPSISWNNSDNQEQIQNVIKSILGMSNIKAVSRIIIGIRQNANKQNLYKNYIKEGVQEGDLRTYDTDKIYQDVRNYGNPAPRFEVKNMKYIDKSFIVFIIQEFLYSPVICIKNGSKLGKEPLVKGALYIRTHKPETKKVDNETEMREIVDLCVEKELDIFSARMQRMFKAMSHISIPKADKTDTGKFISETKDYINE